MEGGESPMTQTLVGRGGPGVRDLSGAPSWPGAGAVVGGRDGEVLISVYIRVYIQEKNTWAVLWGGGGGGWKSALSAISRDN